MRGKRVQDLVLYVTPSPLPSPKGRGNWLQGATNRQHLYRVALGWGFIEPRLFVREVRRSLLYRSVETYQKAALVARDILQRKSDQGRGQE